MQGYDADHADIELLRLRNYTIGRKLTEAEVTGPDSLQRIGDLLTAMKPFVSRTHLTYPRVFCNARLALPEAAPLGELNSGQFQIQPGGGP